MLRRLPFVESLNGRIAKFSPAGADLFKSLSIVTVCFLLSKVFSMVASVAYNRYLGPTVLGETRVITLVSQIISVPMMFGLHAAMMKYGSHEENPAPEIATTTWLFGGICLLVGGISWLMRGRFHAWLGISDYKMMWAIISALTVSLYQVFMSILQTLHEFKRRGIMEILMAGLLLPGMLIAHFLVGRHYENQLIALALSYGIPSGLLLWRVRAMLSPRWLFSERTVQILRYGLLMAVSNVAFLVIFAVQPLQIKGFSGEYGIGLFSVYSTGSLQLATIATSVFFSVFFPKMARSSSKHIAWRYLNKGWVRGAVPTFLFFCVTLTLAVLFSGKDKYPLHGEWVLYFALASTLITIHATYAQIITAEGFRGTACNMGIAFVSAAINFWLTRYLLARMGVPGAAVTLCVNYGVTLVMTLVLGQWLIVRRHARLNQPAS